MQVECRKCGNNLSSRDVEIYGMSQLGWTQQEIADAFSMTQQNVQNITKNFNVKDFCNLYKKGKSLEKIADANNTRVPIVASIVLKDLNDLQLFTYKLTKKEG